MAVSAAEKRRERAEAIEELRRLLKPGDVLTTVTRHVARSGMSRSIDVYLFRPSEDGRRVERRWLSGRISEATGIGWDKLRHCLHVTGTGMDMGFMVVYGLSRVLFPNFECIGEGCPSNDHFNGDRDYTPHAHSDGGYALQQEWL